MLVLFTREIAFSRPVQLLHPRNPVYIVPRGDGRFMVGATMIENEERGRVRARALLDLIGAAYTVHPAFGEAEVVEIGCDLRPAFPDNMPKPPQRGPTACSSTASTATASCSRRRSPRAPGAWCWTGAIFPEVDGCRSASTAKLRVRSQAATLAALLAELDYGDDRGNRVEPGVRARGRPARDPAVGRRCRRDPGSRATARIGLMRYDRPRSHLLRHDPSRSRLVCGTALFRRRPILAESVRASGAEIVTVSLRRESGAGRAGESFWSLIRDLGVRVLPNTAGCRTAKEAVTTAQMAREVFGTPWVKLEVIGEDDTLQPDVFGLVEAAGILSRATASRCFPTRPRIWSWPRSCSPPAARC